MIYVNFDHIPNVYDSYYLDVKNKEVLPVNINDGSLPLYQGKDIKKIAKAWDVSYVDALQKFVPAAVDDSGKQYYILWHSENEE